MGAKGGGRFWPLGEGVSGGIYYVCLPMHGSLTYNNRSANEINSYYLYCNKIIFVEIVLHTFSQAKFIDQLTVDRNANHIWDNVIVVAKAGKDVATDCHFGSSLLVVQVIVISSPTRQLCVRSNSFPSTCVPCRSTPDTNLPADVRSFHLCLFPDFNCRYLW